MKQLASLFAVVVAGITLGTQQAQSRLSRSRCPVPITGDETGVIRVRIDPPDAYSKSLSLVLYQVRPGQADTLVRKPPYGVDSLPDLAAGLYRLWVRQIGYHHPRDTVRVGPGEAWCVTAHLARDTIRLREVP